jgi:hypothetical protein
MADLRGPGRGDRRGSAPDGDATEPVGRAPASQWCPAAYCGRLGLRLVWGQANRSIGVGAATDCGHLGGSQRDTVCRVAGNGDTPWSRRRKFCRGHACCQSGLSCRPSRPRIGVGRVRQYRNGVGPFAGATMGGTVGMAWRLRRHGDSDSGGHRPVRPGGAGRASCSFRRRGRLVAASVGDGACAVRLLAVPRLWYYVRRICRPHEFSSGAAA